MFECFAIIGVIAYTCGSDSLCFEKVDFDRRVWYKRKVTISMVHLSQLKVRCAGIIDTIAVK